MSEVTNKKELLNAKNVDSLIEWLENFQKSGTVYILFFVAIITMTAIWMLGYGIYYFLFGKLDPAPKMPIWISIVDYQDKLTTEQQEVYLEYSWRQFEKEIEHERALVSQADNETYPRTLFPQPSSESFWNRFKRVFFERKQATPNVLYDCSHSIQDLSELQNSDDPIYFSD